MTLGTYETVNRTIRPTAPLTADEVIHRATVGNGIVVSRGPVTVYLARRSKTELPRGVRRPVYVTRTDGRYAPQVSVFESPQAAFVRIGLDTRTIPEVLK